MKTATAKASVILGGTVLPMDKIAVETSYYSGKHKRHGMNVQVLTLADCCGLPRPCPASPKT